MEGKDIDKSQETGTPQKTENRARQRDKPQQEVGPAKRIRKQVSIQAHSKTSMLIGFCPSQEASGLYPAQVESSLILWPAYTWQLATPSDADPGSDAAFPYTTDPDKVQRIPRTEDYPQTKDIRGIALTACARSNSFDHCTWYTHCHIQHHLHFLR